MIPSTQSLLLAQSYAGSLAHLGEDSLSSSILQGQPYEDSWLNRVKLLWKAKDHYHELSSIYPKDKAIAKSVEEYEHALKVATKDGLTISAISM